MRSALGDMGFPTSFDTIFRVLKLEAPLKCRSTSSSDRYSEETYPMASIVRYNFPARGDMPKVTFTWYDGGLKPRRPDELEENRTFKNDREEENEGLLFVGDGGKILCTFNGGNPKLIPQSKMDSYKQPPKNSAKIARQRAGMARRLQGKQTEARGEFRIRGHGHRVLAPGKCRGAHGTKTKWWDRSNLTLNSEVAQKFVHPERRSGWEL